MTNFEMAQESCRKYFASNPRKDPGFKEMQEISEKSSAQIAIQQRRIAAEAEARSDAELERIKNEQIEAAALAERMKLAAERRAADAELQPMRDAEENKAFANAQKINTQDAYQEFINKYPYGKLMSKAKREMTKKWQIGRASWRERG